MIQNVFSGSESKDYKYLQNNYSDIVDFLNKGFKEYIDESVMFHSELNANPARIELNFNFLSTLGKEKFDSNIDYLVNVIRGIAKTYNLTVDKGVYVLNEKVEESIFNRFKNKEYYLLFPKPDEFIK